MVNKFMIIIIWFVEIKQKKFRLQQIVFINKPYRMHLQCFTDMGYTNATVLWWNVHHKDNLNDNYNVKRVKIQYKKDRT